MRYCDLRYGGMVVFVFILAQASVVDVDRKEDAFVILGPVFDF